MTLARSGDYATTRGPTGFEDTMQVERYSRPIRGSSTAWDVLAFVIFVEAALALIFNAGGFDLLLASPAQTAGFEDRGAGNTVQQLLEIVIYGPGILFILARPAAAIQVVRRGWPLFLLLAYVTASTLWSVEPGTSLRRALAVWIMTFFALHLAANVKQRDTLHVFAFACALMLILSTMAIVVPGVGFPISGPQAGKLRGIFAQKNAFGTFAGVALLTFYMEAGWARRRSFGRLMWIALMGLAAFELVLSNSRTSLLAAIAAFMGIWAARFVFLPVGWHKRFTKGLRATLVGTAAFFGVIVAPALGVTVLTLLGRDLTLTGRVKLWQYAIGIGSQRPWLGAGFKAFWSDKLTYDLRVLHADWGIEDGVKSLTANAHDAYLDVWCDSGFFGLAIFLLFMGTFLVRSAQALQTTGDRVYLWQVGALSFFGTMYLTESDVLDHQSLTWFLLTWSFLSLSALPKMKRPIEHRHTRPQQLGLGLATTT